MKRQNNSDLLDSPPRQVTSWFRSALRYGLVGVGSVGLYVALTSLLHRVLGLDSMLSNATGYAAATVANYLGHFHWSFRTKRSHADASWRFLTVVIVGVVINTAYAAVLVRLTNLPVEVIALTFAILWPIASFVALRLWAFAE